MLPSANAFNLDKSNISSFDIELRNNNKALIYTLQKKCYIPFAKSSTLSDICMLM